MLQDLVYNYLSWEISTISFLQTTWQNMNLLDVFYYINFLGDPRYCFLILSPIGYIFSRKLGETTLIMTALAEHVNTMLKWITFGHRPYWWSQAFIPEDIRPPIIQRRLTCESGPGLPSGHVMVSMVTYFCLVSYLLGHYRESRKHIFGIFTVYAVGIVCVAISRLLLAAHFIHQVSIASIVGICICKIVSSTKLVDQIRISTIPTGLLVFFTGAVVYTLLWLSGFEPTWTEEYAVKYCQKREWVRLETTTLHALVRDSSSIIGVWLTRYVADRFQDWLPSEKDLSVRHKLFNCAIILPVLVMIDKSIHLPPPFFYQAAFVYWSALPVLVCLLKGAIALVANCSIQAIRSPIKSR